MKNEIVRIGKYNYGENIDLDTIPIEDTEQALKDFSEGSRGLEICLREMWMRGLKTYSSSSGKNNVFDIGYIIMEEYEDIFSYLSEGFLNDDRVRIDLIDNMQRIRFAGNDGEKEGAMLFLARDIQSGKKKNKDIVLEKIGEPFPDFWVRKLKNYDSNVNSTYWGEKVIIKTKKI